MCKSLLQVARFLFFRRRARRPRRLCNRNDGWFYGHSPFHSSHKFRNSTRNLRFLLISPLSIMIKMYKLPPMQCLRPYLLLRYCDYYSVLISLINATLFTRLFLFRVFHIIFNYCYADTTRNVIVIFTVNITELYSYI